MTPERQSRNIYNHEERYSKELESLRDDERIHPDNRTSILKYLREARTGKVAKKHSARRLSVARCRKLLCILKLCSIHLRGRFEDVSTEQMENFILGLEDGQILYQRKNSTPRRYSHATVLDVKKILRGFLRWLIKDSPDRLEDLTGWFDMREELPELKAFTLKDAQKMCMAAPSLQARALVMLLIDSGARISEMLNVNCEDIRLEKMEDQSELALMRIRISKTRPRTVSLPIATDLLKQWLIRHPAVECIDDQGRPVCKDAGKPLITFSYSYIKKLLSRLGEEELGWRVTPHAFRRSSASLYARKLSHWALTARLGWTQGSRVPARYIDSSGMVGVEAALEIRAELASKPTAVNTNRSVETPDAADRLASLLRKRPELAELLESALR